MNISSYCTNTGIKRGSELDLENPNEAKKQKGEKIVEVVQNVFSCLVAIHKSGITLETLFENLGSSQQKELIKQQILQFLRYQPILSEQEASIVCVLKMEAEVMEDEDFLHQLKDVTQNKESVQREIFQLLRRQNTFEADERACVEALIEKAKRSKKLDLA